MRSACVYFTYGIVFTKIAEKQKKGQNSFLATCALFDSSGVRFALVSSSCSFAASGKPLFMSFNKIPMPKPIDTDSRFASDRVATQSRRRKQTKKERKKRVEKIRTMMKKKNSLSNDFRTSALSSLSLSLSLCCLPVTSFGFFPIVSSADSNH